MILRPFLKSILLVVLTLGAATCLSPASPLTAFGYADTTGAAADTSARHFAGWVIDSVEIDNRNIYDLEDERYRGVLFRTANRLHMVTRRQIVRRELLLQVGDTYDPDLANETARNLRSRYPINDAWIELEELRPGGLLLRVVTADQWSLNGGLRSLDRDAKETNYRIGIEERNFLGRAQFLSVDYFLRQNYPDYLQLQYREPRIMGRPWMLAWNFRSDPLNRLKSVAAGRPYYSLAQSTSIEAEMTHQAVEYRQPNADGSLLARWMTNSDRFGVKVGLRGGARYQKIGWFGSYRYTAVKTKDTVVYAVSPKKVVFPIDSTYHRLTAGAELQSVKYVLESRLHGFGYVEDIELGLRGQLSYGRAFLPDFNRYYYDLLIADVNLTHKLGPNIISAGYTWSQWLKTDETIRRLSTFDLFWYNNGLSFVTMVVKSHYQSDRSGLLHPLVLGGDTGLRGYESEFTAGSRLHVVNTEARFFTGLELLSVKLGGALFGDIGRTWLPHESMAIEGYHWNIGAGLRISLEQLRRGEIVRIDLVRIEDATWEVSIGTGQYF